MQRNLNVYFKLFVIIIKFNIDCHCNRISAREVSQKFKEPYSKVSSVKVISKRLIVCTDNTNLQRLFFLSIGNCPCARESIRRADPANKKANLEASSSTFEALTRIGITQCCRATLIDLRPDASSLSHATRLQKSLGLQMSLNLSKEPEPIKRVWASKRARNYQKSLSL